MYKKCFGGLAAYSSAGVTVDVPSEQDCTASCQSASAAELAACMGPINAYLDCIDKVCANPTQMQQAVGNQGPCHAETEALDACEGKSSTGAGGSTGLGGTPTPGGRYTCTDLADCCAVSGTTLQQACNTMVTAAAGSDTACNDAMLRIKATYCPSL
jgi:hypothetical protein